MRKVILYLVALSFLIVDLTSCGVAQAVLQIRNETKFECASVVLDDGTVLEGEAVLPNGYSESISFRTENGEKRKIPSSEIDFLTMWNKNHGDNKYVLVYRDAYLGTTKKKGDIFKSRWMLPEATGPHLAVMAYADDFQFNAYGQMLLVGEQIRYYFFKENDSRGYNVASKGYANSVSLARSEIMDFLSDDPDLCKAIKEKRIEPFEFDIICETYSPGNGTSE